MSSLRKQCQNLGFQTILHEFEAVGKKSAWTKFVDVVAELLGLLNTDRLARVMSLVDEVAFSQIEGGKSLSYLAKDFTGLQMYAQSTIEPTEEENAAHAYAPLRRFLLRLRVLIGTYPLRKLGAYHRANG